MELKALDNPALDAMSASARQAPRLRTNRNFHPQLEDPVQRLAIAMEPGTYVRPHRHPATWEVLIPLSGEFDVVVFEADVVSQRRVLGPRGERVLELPAGTWHSVLARQTGSVVFEVKQGPYMPTPAADFAEWAPAEGEHAVAEFMKFLDHAQPGDRWISRALSEAGGV